MPIKPYLPPITKEAFAAAATRQPLTRPALPKTTKAYKAMPQAERAALDDARLRFIQAMPLFDTPDVQRIRTGLEKRRKLNAGHRGASTALAINGEPGIGKTQGTLSVLFEAYNAAMKPGESWAEDGYDHVPVIYVCLSVGTTPKQLKLSLLNFLGRPTRSRERESELDAAVAALVNGCGTQIVALDEVHLLDSNRTGRDSADAAKVLTETCRATFLYAGIALEDSPILSKGNKRSTQIRSRTDEIRLSRYSIATPDDEQVFEGLIEAFETDLPLINHKAGSLADSHAEYIFERTQGRLRGVSELLRLGAMEAIGTGKEKIDRKLLEGLTIDLESETEYAA